MVDFTRELRVAIDTGKVVIGTKETLKQLRMGKPKMIILAANCPEEIRIEIEYFSKLAHVPVYVYPGSSLDLGQVCKRRHMVVALAILDPGDSNILGLVEGGEE